MNSGIAIIKAINPTAILTEKANMKMFICGKTLDKIPIAISVKNNATKIGALILIAVIKTKDMNLTPHPTNPPVTPKEEIGTISKLADKERSKK
jgi:hypothetical protein